MYKRQDVYCALTSDRPYRSAFTRKQAMELMTEEVKNFDLKMFLAFQRVIHSGSRKAIELSDVDELIREIIKEKTENGIKKETGYRNERYFTERNEMCIRDRDYVRSIPDFPEPGIIFRDVTSILQDADGLQLAIDEMQHFVEEVDCDVICGTESRGFIFGMPIAYNLHKPFVPIRKKGKLPRCV